MKKFKIRWKLVLYDIVILLFVDWFLLVFYQSESRLSFKSVIAQTAITFICVFSARIFGCVYQQIWRYGGIQCYIRLLFADGIAFFFNVFAERFLPIQHISFPRLLAIACMNLLGVLAMRMIYRYAYKCGDADTFLGKVMRVLLRIFAGKEFKREAVTETPKIKIAIIGAGSIGVSLAEELILKDFGIYLPVCFVDINKNKSLLNKSCNEVYAKVCYLIDNNISICDNDGLVHEIFFMSDINMQAKYNISFKELIEKYVYDSNKFRSV